MKYFVVGSHIRFMAWCRENNLNPRDKDVIFVSRPQDAMGHKLTEEDRIVNVGGPSYEVFDLLQILRSRRG